MSIGMKLAMGIKTARKIQEEWALDQVPGYALVLDNSARFVSCNQSFHDTSPYALEELLGGLWFRSFHYAYASEFLTEIKNNCSSGDNQFSMSIRLQTSETEFKWMQFQALKRDYEGIKLYLLVGQDVSKSFDDSRMLDWSQRQAKIGSFLYDLRSDRTTWSKEACRILDIPRGSTVSFFDVAKKVQREDQKEFETSTRALLGGEQSFRARLLLWNESSKSLMWTQWIVESIFYGDEVTGFEGSIQDVSEEVLNYETQLQQEKLSTVGEATAQIIHDVMSPLSIIGGNVDRLDILNEQETPNKEALLKTAAQMRKSVDRIYGIFQDIRSLIKNDVAAEPLLVGAILEEASFFVRDRADKMGASLYWAVEQGLHISAHKGQMIQVFINLLKNSLDAIGDLDDKWIRITAGSTEEKVVISVKDSGGGIPEKIAKRIFDSLFSTKTATGGTGIGLGLCKKILSTHGGNLYLNSDSDNTEFIMELPLCEEKEAAA